MAALENQGSVTSLSAMVSGFLSFYGAVCKLAPQEMYEEQYREYAI